MLDPRIGKWIVSRDTGLSSEAIMAALFVRNAMNQLEIYRWVTECENEVKP